MPEDEGLISRIERHALTAWPAFESEAADGWLLRAAEGYTKRANSASALMPSALPWTAAARFYGARGLPLLFRLSPLGQGVAGALRARGFAPFEPSLVLTRPPLADALPAGLRLAARPDAAWLDDVAAAHGVAAPQRASHARILAAIRPPAVFATLHAGGQPVAYGLAVAGDGLVGLFDILTRPACRRAGHARRLVEGLIGWGRRQGAELAYLQVVEANRAARALYDGLGFQALYGYDYWRRTPACAK